MNHLPIAEACLRNQEPIAKVLTHLLEDAQHVLELGSGTGQHAVYMAKHLPHLIWQPSELAERIHEVEAWRVDQGLNNIKPCLNIDVSQDNWPLTEPVDAIFTANTVHYISQAKVDAMFTQAAQHLSTGGQFIIYGPFTINGEYTSEGNYSLDLWLKERDPSSGIKDLAGIQELAAQVGISLKTRYEMPANNMLLHFVRHEVKHEVKDDVKHD